MLKLGKSKSFDLVNLFNQAEFWFFEMILKSIYSNPAASYFNVY